MIPLENREEDWWFLFSQIGGIGPKTLHKLQRFCWRNGLHPRELRERHLDGIEGSGAFSRPLIARWREELDERHRGWRLLASLKRLGVQLLTPKSPSYPASLNLLEKLRPVPLLLALGSVGLLARPRVAIVSSSGVSLDGLGRAEFLAGKVKEKGGVIVGGQSRALDLAVNPEVVLARTGLLAFVEENGVRGGLVVSPWSPDYTHHDRYATTRMALEKTWVLLGLSTATAVVELKKESRLVGLLEQARAFGFPIFSYDRDPSSGGGELAALLELMESDREEQ